MKMTTIALLRPMILSNLTNRLKCQIKKGNNSKHFHNSVCAKNPVAWTMDKGMGTTRNNDNDSEEQKWMTSNLWTKYQMLNGTLATLQGKLENLELKVENCALKENAEQKANYQTLEAKLKDEFAKMLANQNEQYQKEITQLESKYRMLEEKLSPVKLQTREMTMTTNGVIEKQLGNPQGNSWKEPNPNATISRDGLKLENKKLQHVYAEKGFDISGDFRKENNFTGTIIYYFEVKQTSPGEFQIGLSDGYIPAVDGSRVGDCLNSYGVPNSNYCWISGKEHSFEWPKGATKPERVGPSAGGVEGCGLLLSPDNKLAIFLTMDGILLGKAIPISPSAQHLYPTVDIWEDVSLEANFGDDPDKPFNFDIAKCPQLVFP